MSQKRSKYERVSTTVDSNDGIEDKEFTLFQKVGQGNYKEDVELIFRDQLHKEKLYYPSSSRSCTSRIMACGVIIIFIVAAIVALAIVSIGYATYILWFSPIPDTSDYSDNTKFTFLTSTIATTLYSTSSTSTALSNTSSSIVAVSATAASNTSSFTSYSFTSSTSTAASNTSSSIAAISTTAASNTSSFTSSSLTSFTSTSTYTTATSAASNIPSSDTSSSETDNLLPPSSTSNGTLWSVDFEPATTELSLLIHDINHDGVPDILMDRMTKRVESGSYYLCPGKPDKCMEELGFSPCRVCVMALDGRTGSVIWESWLDFAPFAASCRHDLNGDGISDCILAGRSGSLVVLDPVDGSIVWVVEQASTFSPYNYYYPLLVRDFDRDGTIDIISTHGGDQMYSPDMTNRSPGLIYVVSGLTGQQISARIPMPDDHETYSSPVSYNITGNIEVVLFGSGGETISGSLWAITLDSLQEHIDNWAVKVSKNYEINKKYIDPRCSTDNEIRDQRPKNAPGTFSYDKKEDWMDKCPKWSKDIQVLWNPYKLCTYEFVPAGKTGNILPPVIIDVNNDNVLDLVVSQFNDHTLLIDGASGTIVWDHYVSDTQSYSIPAPLYFNDDDIPDYLIRFNKGEWMTYDYSYMGVVDGENGNLLWSFNCSMGAMASGVTVKNKKKGHDGMLFFANGCEGERQRMKRDSFEQDTCPRMYIEIERTTCEAQKRNKRHEEHEEHEEEGAILSDIDEDTNDNSSSQIPRMPDIDYNQVLNAVSKDIWEIHDETDSFPDPWTDSYTFMQDYCEIPVDSMTTRVYYLTPNLITSGHIKPIYEFKPYVYKAPSDNLLRMKRHGSMSSDHNLEILLHNRKMVRCAHILAPYMLPASPAVGDFNQDGKLDGVVSIMYFGLLNDLVQFTIFHPPKVIVKAFTLEDRLKEVYGTDANIVDFSTYYPAHQQPWTQYMGSQGNGVYTITTD